MPVEFENCVKRGGRVRTINPNAGTYMHVCYIGGKSYASEIHHKGSNSEKKKHKLSKKLK